MHNHGLSAEYWREQDYLEGVRKERKMQAMAKRQVTHKYSYKLSPSYQLRDCCGVMPLVTEWRDSNGSDHRVQCEVCRRFVTTVDSTIQDVVDKWNSIGGK